MKFTRFKSAPVLIATGVIALTCLLRWLRPDELEQLEARTFDWRARLATRFPAAAATNLGFVAISDDSITRLKDGSLGFHYGLYWPRHIYGQLLRELTAQGATAVGFDILFAETRPDHSTVKFNTNSVPDLENFAARLHPNPEDKRKPLLFRDQVAVESDDFFAWQLQRSGNVILAAEKGLLPDKLFRDHAAALGDISAERDSDGVLRRARAFKTYRAWHPIFEQSAAEYGLDLSRARIEPRQITLTTPDKQEIKVPLAADGTFNPVDFGGAAAANIPRAKPFTDRRVWHMGIVLAARGLGLDLSKAEADLPGGKILLRNTDTIERVIPVDADGFFYVNWELPPGDPRLTVQPLETLLAQDIARARGETNALENSWRGKLVIVGSTATGNDLTDRGATPLENDTVLMSKHWNVANAVLTGRFIRRPGLLPDCLIIALLGALSAVLTLRLRAVPGLVSVLAAAAIYGGLAALLFVQHRLWLPLVLPVTGGLLLQNACLVTWRAVFEQAEQRRIRSVFSKIVAPEVVHELLEAENIHLGGTRREITVFFADVRGFTAFTDASRDAAVAIAREKNLSGPAAEEHFDREASETLDTVNAYLALVADQIKAHGGTLDKYIGDCVMAFWNAPTPTPQHALACVRAAIAAQRAIDDLNRQRAEANNRRELENIQRAATGKPPLPPLPILTLGTGINTGQAVVGLMGSDAHILNYTAFGREVNLASRLEALSGRGRIFIGETTFAALQRDGPALAATCTALAPVNVKGIRESVRVYEIAWRVPGTISPIADDYGSASAADTSATGFMRKN